MVRMVGRGRHVLEVGCASGYMSRHLSDAGNRVVGIEVDADAAEQARVFCERVIVANLDVRSLGDVCDGMKFDVIVFGDVLEHLADPWKVLSESRALLENDGYVVISIPNIAHGNVRLSLLRGSFDYTAMGLLDNTHLRFFTIRSLRELCLRAGFTIDRIERTKVPLFGQTGLVPQVDAKDFEPATISDIRRDPEHDTLQFVVLAVPIPEGEHVRVALETLADAEIKLAQSGGRIERLERQLAEYVDAEERLLEIEIVLADQTSEATEARSVANALSAHVAELESARDALREELQEALGAGTETERSVDERLALVEELGALRSTLLEREASIHKLEEQLEQRSAIEEEVATLRAQSEQREAMMATLRHEIADRGALTAELAKLRKQNEENKGLEAEVADLRARIDERQAIFGELRAELANRSADAQEVATLQARGEQRETMLSELRSETAALRDELSDLSRLKGEVQALRSALAQRDADIVRIRSENGAAVEQHAAMTLALAEMHRDYDMLHAAHEEAFREWGALRLRLPEVESEARAREAAAAETIADLRALIGSGSVSASVSATAAGRVTSSAELGVQGEALQRLDVEIQHVAAAHVATVEAFAGHIDAEIAMVRAEMAEIDDMIKRIQRSPAWLLKKMVGRMRVAIPRGRARV